MTRTAPTHLWRAFEATWPPAGCRPLGPFLIRDGAGGGKRVSAARATGAVAEADIAVAETAMAAEDRPPLFVVRSAEGDLDAMLAARGYGIVDATEILLSPTSQLVSHVPPRLTAIEVYPPLAIMAEIWSAAGIGPARLGVMARASDPKTTFLGRHKDRAVAAAFAAASDGIAFVHALTVLPDYRRMGVARNLMAGAAHWAARHDIPAVAVAVTRENETAQALYASLGFEPVESYHYRSKATAGEGQA